MRCILSGRVTSKYVVIGANNFMCPEDGPTPLISLAGKVQCSSFQLQHGRTDNDVGIIGSRRGRPAVSSPIVPIFHVFIFKPQLCLSLHCPSIILLVALLFS